MRTKGFVCAFWSGPEGCWWSLGNSEDRERVERLRLQLVAASDLEVTVLPVASIDPADVEVELDKLEAPYGVSFIRPSACSS